MLVATYRFDGLERGNPIRGLLAELDRAERVEHLRLSPFGPGDVAEQLRGILGTQPPDSLVSAVLERSDGNPFFAEELAAVSGEGSIPPGLHELLLARLDRLDKGAQAVVRAAAIGGRRIGHRLLAAAVELPTDVLDAGLRAARQHHLLLVDEQGYVFRHALVHEAVLGELLPGERAALHASFARAIDFDHALVGAGWAAALVHHWSAAGRNDRAIAPALAAAVDAELAYALPEAQRYYDWLLATLDEDATADLPVSRAEIVDRAADVASRAGDLDRAAQLVADALDELDPRARCGSRRDPPRAARLVSAAARSGRRRVARPTSRRSAWFRSYAGDGCPGPRPGRQRRRPGTSRPAAPRRRAGVGSGRCGHRGAVARRRRARSDTRWAWPWRQMGDLEGGLAELDKALELALRGGDVADAVGIHRHLWRLVVAEGRAEEFVATTIEQASTARTTAMAVLAGVLDAIAAGYCHQLGRWAEADELLTNLDPQRLDGIVQLVVAALLDADRGDIQCAGDRLEIVRANTLGLRDGRLDGLLFRGLAERAWSRGHLGAVAEIVDEGMQRTTDKEMIAGMALVGMRAGRWSGSGGRPLGEVAPTSRRVCRPAPSRGRRRAAFRGDDRARPSWLGSPDSRTRRRGLLPSTAGIAPGFRIRRRTVVGGMAKRCSAPAANGMLRPPSLRRRAQRLSAWVPDRSPAAIEQAARRARLPVGAAADAAASGRSTDSEFGITAREFEVLELLARGLTNKQIAETLFISEKTARVHVSHLLTKLGRLDPRRRRRRRPPPQPARPQMSAGRSFARCARRRCDRIVAGVARPAQDHAVVVGASMAGLLTAQALSRHFRRVTIIERDCLPNHSSNRPGVPQGDHLHVILPGGQQAMERLLPGLADELVAAGAVNVGDPHRHPLAQPGRVDRSLRCTPPVHLGDPTADRVVHPSPGVGDPGRRGARRRLGRRPAPRVRR